MEGKDVLLLIVEDDHTALDLYRYIVFNHFPELVVHTADNPEDALSLFGRFRHDIVMTDNRLPFEDEGLRIAHEICERKPDAIIFILTGDPDISLKGKNLCLEDILKKPILVERLVEDLRQAIEKTRRKGATSPGQEH
jgi:DNA-binding NtrC family response regulator